MSSYRDHYGRSLEYLRVSVTDRCNFRCPYCRPETGELYDPPADHLKAAEIARVVDVSRQLGVRAVRFTGGEPLLRRDLPDVIAAVRDLGVTDLALTTNAWRLAKRTKSLWQAGLRRINISLDALSKDRFRRLSGGLDIEPTLKGIDAAIEQGFEVKTNTVVMAGENSGELLELAQFAWARGLTPRFIELMPIGAGALATHRRIDVEEILQAFDAVPEPQNEAIRYGRGPASYWYHEGKSHQKLGVIGATTRNFCASCNRARLTATGGFRPCLASNLGYEIRPLLRQGCTDQELLNGILEGMGRKPEGHRFHEGLAGQNAMRGIGG